MVERGKEKGDTEKREGERERGRETARVKMERGGECERERGGGREGEKTEREREST